MTTMDVDNFVTKPGTAIADAKSQFRAFFLFRQYRDMLKAGATSWLDDSKTRRASNPVRRGASVKKSDCLQYARPASDSRGISDPKRATTGDETFYQLSA